MRGSGMDGALVGALGFSPEGEPEEADSEYEAVEGLSRADIECVRAHEQKAAMKTASDYEHIVWAYGVIWSVFAIYGVMLWRRGLRLSADMRSLNERIDRS